MDADPSLSENDRFLAKGYGLYPHRQEPGFFMLRLKIPNGVLNALQLKAIAKIAAEQNKGFADLTTRQGIQLHWVAAREVPSILNELSSIGITTLGASGDTLRNIVGCPVAGVDASEYFDASPVLRQAHDFFAGNPEYANLPRKLKVSISACRQQCQQPEIHCVSFVGFERGGEGALAPSFDLRVGGGLSTRPYFAKRLDAAVGLNQVVPTLKAIAEIYRDAPEYRESRVRARMKFLVADWGVERFRQALQDKLDFPLESPGALEDPPDSYKDHTGVHEQKQPGLFFVGAPVLIGRVTDKQMRRAAELAQTYGDGSIRLTVRQNLLILNVPKDKVAQVLEGLESVGLGVNASPVARGVVTCTGIEFCKLAITETKARAREIVEHLEKRIHLEEPLRIHVTGCPSTCVQSPIAHIGLQGSRLKVGEELVEAYDVAVGGELGRDRAFNHFVARKIPADEVKIRLTQLLAGYKKLRGAGEGFNAFCRRVGDEAVAKLLEPSKEPEAVG